MMLIITAILLVIAMIIFLFYMMQEKIILHPGGNKKDVAMYEDVYYWKYGIALQPNINHNNVLIFIYGNAGQSQHYTSQINFLLKDTNFDGYIIDYPGYSACSDLEVGVENTKTHVKNALLNIKDKYEGNIYVMGFSMGCSFASYASQTVNIDKLILINPFTTLADIAKNLMYIPNWFVRYDLNNMSWLTNAVKNGNVNNVIIISNREDNVILSTFHDMVYENVNKLNIVVEKYDCDGGHMDWEKRLDFIKLFIYS